MAAAFSSVPPFFRYAGMPVAPTVIADRGGDAGRFGAAADHGVRVGLVHRRARERPSRLPRQRREQRPLGIVAQSVPSR